MPRPTWRGFLKVSLVNITVKVFPTPNRPRRCRSTSCTPSAELARGYEFEKGRYVIVSEEDIKKVRVESTRVINLVQFANASEIDPIYVDRA